MIRYERSLQVPSEEFGCCSACLVNPLAGAPKAPLPPSAVLGVSLVTLSSPGSCFIVVAKLNGQEAEIGVWTGPV